MQKFIFYLFFAALATTVVEVLSLTNLAILINPGGYLVYGLLYIFFLDYIFRKQINDWKTIYLFGMLVGFITESYFAKVVFFGWPDNNLILHGFAIKEMAILIFFIHPFFAFMLPIWIAKNFFKFPFNIKETKRKWLIFLLPIYPLIWTSSANIKFSGESIIPLSITTFLFTIYTVLFDKFGKTKNILLTKTQKTIAFILGFIFYIWGYFNAPIFGRSYVDTPSLFPLTISFIFVAIIFFIIWVRSKKRITIERLEYKESFNSKKAVIYFIYLYFCMLISIPIATIISLVPVMIIIILIGTLLGFLYYIYICIDTVRMLFVNKE